MLDIFPTLGCRKEWKGNAGQYIYHLKVGREGWLEARSNDLRCIFASDELACAEVFLESIRTSGNEVTINEVLILGDAEVTRADCSHPILALFARR